MIFFSSPISLLQAQHQNQNFDKAAFYKVLESGDLSTIELQLKNIKDLPAADAFEGALLMKKSGMLSKAKDKLNSFKAGRAKLEGAIAKDNKNAEYRFLRIIIQEHAPKVVKYKLNITDDSKYVQANYKSLSPALQQIILEYSQQSTFLKLP